MERLMKPSEVAHMLQVGKSTPYAWAYRGRVPYVKLGSAVRFRQSDVEALVRASTRRTKPGRQTNSENCKRTRVRD